MHIRVGYEIVYDCPQDTPMIFMLHVHYSRASDMVVPDHLTTFPSVPISAYRDSFGNWCSRIVAPRGQIRVSSTAVVRDNGVPDLVLPHAKQHRVQDLPEDTLMYLLGSRYCETDRLSDIAWSLFGNTEPGWARVQAISTFVHNHITFGYQYARSTRTAWEAYNEGVGVCRDFAHLGVAFSRCMNIPARYCTGYLGDIGVPPVDAPMDFAGWYEVYLDGAWHTVDPRNYIPRIGRIVIARGRDAVDVPISHTFGSSPLVSFKVWTDEIAPVS